VNCNVASIFQGPGRPRDCFPGAPTDSAIASIVSARDLKGQGLHSRIEPAAASQSELDAVADCESPAHVEFKATEKTGIETSARPRESI